MVWRTLGFGGRPNPLVFSRVASFAARSAQALLSHTEAASVEVSPSSSAPGRLQLYVDDPVVSVRASEAKAHETLDLVILWWLVLGIPLSWKKGSFTQASVPHRWIGIDYTLRSEGAVMRLPDSFVADLKTLIAPLCKMTGYIGKTELDAIIGKAARVAFVVPMAKPFVAGLWGGLYAAIKESNLGVYSAPPGCVPCRRLCYAASWVWALLSDEEECPLRLERLVGPGVPRAASPGGWTIEFDASIYGGGGVLRNPDREVVEYFSIVWNGEEAKHLHVVPGDSRHQTFWEYATLLLCLMTWGDNFVKESVLVVGDNTGSLSMPSR